MKRIELSREIRKRLAKRERIDYGFLASLTKTPVWTIKKIVHDYRELYLL